eukprot:CAMPEP_0174253878 /NCGR_PEP_ID=MMETSP0439-20130205/3251_1 /TAXON_ID=0 /ORGANISM="Stereomyxa ramosa, Strain Chinc5" /LENGTH=107 /DNA_ID=CAMNT_0015335171 /DNA_START=998 /DNA_END=1321 /DNA_ORIENTATION=+
MHKGVGVGVRRLPVQIRILGRLIIAVLVAFQAPITLAVDEEDYPAWALLLTVNGLLYMELCFEIYGKQLKEKIYNYEININDNDSPNPTVFDIESLIGGTSSINNTD